MATVEDMVNAELKVRAFKNEVDPDGRVELCGERVKRDEKGREYFEIPAHQLDYLSQLLTGYEFSEPYKIGTEAPPIKKDGRRRK